MLGSLKVTNLIYQSKVLLFSFFLLSYQVYAAPSTPAAPNADLTGTTLTLSWSPVIGASYYKLGFRDSNGSWGTSGAKYYGKSQTWSNVTGLNDRTYRLQACDSNNSCSGWSGASNPVSSLSIPTIPGTPSAAATGTTLNLTWGSSSGADYYQLQFRDGSGSWFSSGTNYSGTSQTWTNVSPITNRSYRMRACNAAGCSAYSSASNPVTIYPTPTVPTSPNAATVGYELTLTWGESTHAQHYKLQFRDGSGNWNNANGAYYGGSHTWPNVGILTNRSYRLKACNPTACSNYSVASNAVTTYPTPMVPGTPAASTVGYELTLTWGESVHAQHYKLQFRDGTGNWIDANGTYSGGSQTWQNIGVITNRSYRLSACNPTACSNYSVASNAITTLATPAIPTAPTATGSDTTNTVTWVSVQHATYYQIQVSFNNGNWTATTDVNDTTYSWSELGEGDRRYRLRACNQTACSGYSAPSNTVTTTLNMPPTVTPTAPAANAQLSESAPVVASATGADSDGTIAHIEFSLDGTNWNRVSVAPYEYSFGLLPIGNYTVSFRSIDDDGALSTTVTRTISVTQTTMQRKVIFLHTDLLGSPVAESDNTGQIIE